MIGITRATLASFAFAAVVLFCSACGSGNAPQPAPKASEPVAGGYGDERPLEDRDLEVFEKAFADDAAARAEYEPLAVATQVVAGTNFRFTCDATRDGVQSKAYVYIFEALPTSGGNTAVELVNVEPVPGDS